MGTDDIRGVMVPIITPLTTDENRVDVFSLRRLVNYLLDNGVHGIWASGSMMTQEKSSPSYRMEE